MSAKHRYLWESVGGNVPEHWEFKTIEELLEHSKAISVGVMYPGSDTENGVPLIKVSDVKNGAIAAMPTFCISNELDEEHKRTRLNGTELLITLVGNPGDCVVVTEKMIGWNAARALAVVRLEDMELRAWLRYILLSKPAKHLIEARLNTTVQKTLNLKDIRELGLPIPPKNEREEITKVIDAIEDKMLLNRQTNQTLEDIAQAIFKSWFVDFEPTRAKMTAKETGQDPELAAMAAISGKPVTALDQLTPEKYQELKTTAALFPDSLVDSELGEIPEGWEESTLSSWGNVVCGKTPSKKKEEYYGGGIPFIKIPDMHGNMYVVETIDSLTLEGADTQKKKILPKGSVCVSCIATVGQVLIVCEESFTNQQINSIVPFNKKHSSYLYFSMLGLYDLFQNLASGGSATLNLNTGNFSKIKIVKPSDHTLQHFENKVAPIMSGVLEKQRQQKVLVDIRDTLLPKLLSGELQPNPINQ